MFKLRRFLFLALVLLLHANPGLHLAHGAMDIAGKGGMEMMQHDQVQAEERGMCCEQKSACVAQFDATKGTNVHSPNCDPIGVVSLYPFITEVQEHVAPVKTYYIPPSQVPPEFLTERQLK